MTWTKQSNGALPLGNLGDNHRSQRPCGTLRAAAILKVFLSRIKKRLPRRTFTLRVRPRRSRTCEATIYARDVLVAKSGTLHVFQFKCLCLTLDRLPHRSRYTRRWRSKLRISVCLGLLHIPTRDTTSPTRWLPRQHYIRKCRRSCSILRGAQQLFEITFLGRSVWWTLQTAYRWKTLLRIICKTLFTRPGRSQQGSTGPFRPGENEL